MKELFEVIFEGVNTSRLFFLFKKRLKARVIAFLILIFLKIFLALMLMFLVNY